MQPEPTGGPTGNDPTPQHAAAARGERTYHDSLTGAQVTSDGQFVDESRSHEGPIPANRIVADDWPNLQTEADAQATNNTDRIVAERTARGDNK